MSYYTKVVGSIITDDTTPLDLIEDCFNYGVWTLGNLKYVIDSDINYFNELELDELTGVLAGELVCETEDGVLYSLVYDKHKGWQRYELDHSKTHKE